MSTFSTAEQNYINSQKSDPFCAARVATHKRLGIHGYSARHKQVEHDFVGIEGDAQKVLVDHFTMVERP